MFLVECGVSLPYWGQGAGRWGWIFLLAKENCFGIEVITEGNYFGVQKILEQCLCYLASVVVPKGMERKEKLNSNTDTLPSCTVCATFSQQLFVIFFLVPFYFLLHRENQPECLFLKVGEPSRDDHFHGPSTGMISSVMGGCGRDCGERGVAVDGRRPGFVLSEREFRAL